ncbi:tRNA (adenosine(37)-N6)-threonylcarbamoyltransferase complex dimerization subunit type 1 TsaB [Xylanimonas oleitrophica]|uniref:tRNA (Adenosine(37)-N6)-threonylcarbamoyltransferase complex dimerization subunit type 1 TsaB n=1 Tax=Xylanimonas oleitrophica TaxID=2607479 RepID=A0A2W5WW34_9MICO|nr:tRNA (adenosine(37)-N6)-threonylcarbamoyltransferase complex dimerization subunit type 1 TsaB [Xylanimonas oleitrophica]PZR54902.1 tRNA (adenosine(37)-N6)-threonylcarbamoyltransferase complex dimerization subunit type 1 TsaB [Xylanimonas oleitrophica]
MAVLSIDTSAAVAVALVAEDGTLLAARSVDERRRHAEQLAPMIAGVLAEAGLDRGDLTAVVGGTGPAPFTGLRVGLVTARTLALAVGVPALGVPSLDALAVQAVTDLALAPDDEVLVATDARRKEVYWARYRVVSQGGIDGVPVVEPVAGPDVARPADLGDALAPPAAGRLVVVGEGATLYPDVLTVTDGAPVQPDAAALARVALQRRDAGLDLPTEPLYLRRPDVQEPVAKPRVVPATGAVVGGDA